MLDSHIQKIMDMFDSKKKVVYVAESVDLEEIMDTREVIDITKLNAEIATTVARNTQLRADINAIVAEIEAGGNRSISHINYLKKIARWRRY